MAHSQISAPTVTVTVDNLDRQVILCVIISKRSQNGCIMSPITDRAVGRMDVPSSRFVRYHPVEVNAASHHL